MGSNDLVSMQFNVPQDFMRELDRRDILNTPQARLRGESITTMQGSNSRRTSMVGTPASRQFLHRPPTAQQLVSTQFAALASPTLLMPQFVQQNLSQPSVLLAAPMPLQTWQGYSNPFGQNQGLKTVTMTTITYQIPPNYSHPITTLKSPDVTESVLCKTGEKINKADPDSPSQNEAIRPHIEDLLKQIQLLRDEKASKQKLAEEREENMKAELAAEKKASEEAAEKLKELEKQYEDAIGPQTTNAESDEAFVTIPLMGIEVERMHHVKNELVEAVRGLNGTVGGLEEENDQLQQRLSDLQYDIQLRSRRLLEVESQPRDTSTDRKARELARERETLLRELNQASEMNSQLLAKLEEAKGNGARVDRLQEEITRREMENGTLWQQVAAQEKVLRQQRQDSEMINDELERARRLLSEKSEEAARLNTSEVRLQSEIVSLKTRLLELEAKSAFSSDKYSYRKHY
eukprot:TRINITY_DN10374_c0_g1_i1.p1 TRINITY_DN10374_c0_g1~~TRINITY_DN10374_c0_g1_i1.p1  ORF type:complete len:475 (-),score=103.23 TRINITY_DN10374_c0_g1_i1:95-1480(-)